MQVVFTYDVYMDRDASVYTYAHGYRTMTRTYQQRGAPTKVEAGPGMLGTWIPYHDFGCDGFCHGSFPVTVGSRVVHADDA